MKLGKVTKFDKEKLNNVKKFDDNLIFRICDVIAIFLIYGQFGPIWKPDSGRIVCKTYITTSSNFYLTKAENRTKKSLTQLSLSYISAKLTGFWY